MKPKHGRCILSFAKLGIFVATDVVYEGRYDEMLTVMHTSPTRLRLFELSLFLSPPMTGF